MALSDSERAEYLRCHKEASAQYQRYRHGGLKCINRHLLQLIGLTHPLRLICAGGALRLQARPLLVPHRDLGCMAPATPHLRRRRAVPAEAPAAFAP